MFNLFSHLISDQDVLDTGILEDEDEDEDEPDDPDMNGNTCNGCGRVVAECEIMPCLWRQYILANGDDADFEEDDDLDPSEPDDE